MARTKSDVIKFLSACTRLSLVINKLNRPTKSSLWQWFLFTLSINTLV